MRVTLTDEERIEFEAAKRRFFEAVCQPLYLDRMAALLARRLG